MRLAEKKYFEECLVCCTTVLPQAREAIRKVSHIAHRIGWNFYNSLPCTRTHPHARTRTQQPLHFPEGRSDSADFKFSFFAKKKKRTSLKRKREPRGENHIPKNKIRRERTKIFFLLSLAWKRFVTKVFIEEESIQVRIHLLQYSFLPHTDGWMDLVISVSFYCSRFRSIKYIKIMEIEVKYSLTCQCHVDSTLLSHSR